MEVATTKEIKEVVMQIPSVTEKVYEPKRYAGQPHLEWLKEQQMEAFQSLEAFLAQPEGGFCLVNGFAGTGKTFLIGMAIETLLQKYPTAAIAMTAPTNKAVKVLKRSADFVHSNLKYLTIHSLLGLKEQITNFGKQIFVQDKKNPPKIEEYQYLVIDEVSMLSDDLWELLVPYTGEFTARKKQTPMFGDYGMIRGTEYGHSKSRGLKIIMMGDPAQIPPVGKKDCIPFDIDEQIKYNIGVSLLTDIQRQALDNPIVNVTMKIRNNLNRATTFPTRETILNDKGQGVVFLDKTNPDHGDLMEEILEKYFNSDNFREDADFMKVVAWRNKTVAYMNKWIRAMLYGEDARERIVVGEKLIADKPVFDGPMIVFNTNDEFEVLSYTMDTEEINGGQYNINYYAAKVQYIADSGAEITAIVKIVAEDSLDTYNEIVEALVNVAKSHKQGSWEAGRAWQDKFAFEETFAAVNYNYAITGHKSQGSTYENVMVLENDINANQTVYERNRIKYTACSRPKNRLFIVH